MTDTIKKPAHLGWREKFDDMRKGAEAAEVYAMGLYLKALSIGETIDTFPGFEIRWGWAPVAIDWCCFSEQLEEFSRRVQLVTDLIGAPPDKCDARHWLMASDENDAGDLVAEWSKETTGTGCEVFVRVLMPKGCKVDPRTRFLPAESPSVHPECKAVLDGLTDLEPCERSV
jgi:hypothetical protein